MKVGLAVEALTLALGSFHLRKLDLTVPRGEILVMLGPNGAGKSVTLETIAGFHRPLSGRILIGGRDVTALPPERRRIGFVVQTFGLFPHLSVAQNVAIARRSGPLALPGGERSLAEGDTAALLDYFGIAQLGHRAPQDLSPGEKQRAALARALAGAPDLFLFDEPFAALDAQTHGLLRDELLGFLRRLSIPAVLVTHDHTDALTLADTVMVLRDGAMVQSSSATEIFQRPKDSFVARFVGVENVLSGRVTAIVADVATVEVGARTLRAGVPALFVTANRPVLLGIHAEDVRLYPSCAAPPQSGVNRLEGRVTALRPMGPLVTVVLDCGFPLHAYVLRPQLQQMGLGVGVATAVEIAAASIHLMKE